MYKFGELQTRQGRHVIAVVVVGLSFIHDLGFTTKWEKVFDAFIFENGSNRPNWKCSLSSYVSTISFIVTDGEKVCHLFSRKKFNHCFTKYLNYKMQFSQFEKSVLFFFYRNKEILQMSLVQFPELFCYEKKFHI